MNVLDMRYGRYFWVRIRRDLAERDYGDVKAVFKNVCDILRYYSLADAFTIIKIEDATGDVLIKAHGVSSSYAEAKRDIDAAYPGVVESDAEVGGVI